MWDEQIHKPEFIHQRHYDMRGSKVRCDCWSPLKLPVCEIAPVEAQTEYTQACHVGRTDIHKPEFIHQRHYDMR